MTARCPGPNMNPDGTPRYDAPYQNPLSTGNPADIICRQQEVLSRQGNLIADQRERLDAQARAMVHANARIAGLEDQNAALAAQLMAYARGEVLRTKNGGLLHRIRRKITRA